MTERPLLPALCCSLACHASARAGGNSFSYRLHQLFIVAFSRFLHPHVHTHTNTHTCTHTHTHRARAWGCRTHLGWSYAGAMQGLGAFGCCDSCACLTPAKETCLSRGGLLCAANKYCGPFPAGGFGSFWALRRHLAHERLLCMGLSSNPELSCRCSSEQSGPRLCCWPQQCAFVGVMGPGCSNLPWALDRGEWPACMCISGWACSTWPHPPCMHYGEPSALSASSLGCLADLQPDWLCPGGCPRTAEVVGGHPGAQRCPRELLGGSVASPVPHSPLSPHTACGLRTPRGMWSGLSHIPLQLQPALSKFI